MLSLVSGVNRDMEVVKKNTSQESGVRTTKKEVFIIAALAAIAGITITAVCMPEDRY